MESNNTTAVFIVQDLDQIKNVIIPVFNKRNLLSVKMLDYLLFREAINIKGNSSKLSDDQFNKIQSIKENMNFKRIDYSNYNKIEFDITPYWLLGFVEAEGTFGIKNPGREQSSLPGFQWGPFGAPRESYSLFPSSSK